MRQYPEQDDHCRGKEEKNFPQAVLAIMPNHALPQVPKATEGISADRLISIHPEVPPFRISPGYENLSGSRLFADLSS